MDRRPQFSAANLGSLELMGWAAAAYQYGILAAHWYWIGAIPAMLFLGIVMMPFYYISKTHSVPGYLKLRFGEASRALSAISFALDDRVHERHQHVFDGAGDESGARLGHQFQHLGFFAYGCGVRHARRASLSAIFNEVLQFVLIWAGALLIPILGLVEAGGWTASAGASDGQRFRGVHAPVVAP